MATVAPITGTGPVLPTTGSQAQHLDSSSAAGDQPRRIEEASTGDVRLVASGGRAWLPPESAHRLSRCGKQNFMAPGTGS
jgi:hypothetical protein